MIGQGARAFVAALLLLGAGCDAQRVELVAETDDEAAGFGRSALRAAMVILAETPTSAQAYEKFSARIHELMPVFNRSVRREAELRLVTLAIAPLEAGLNLPPRDQMRAFATTVWPSVLEFPRLERETTEDYVSRLCASEFALDCNNVIPERWPAILNAKVWRALKSRVEVSFGRCRWCDTDKEFTELVKRSHDIHIQVELAARRAVEGGTPAEWPVAGRHSSPLVDEVVINFASSGHVTVGGRTVPRGDWRDKIREIRGDRERIALHMAPERLVADLLQVVADIRAAGYRKVAMVARRPEFPYAAVTYSIDAGVKTSRDLEVHNGDTIQILIQALDHRAAVPNP